MMDWSSSFLTWLHEVFILELDLWVMLGFLAQLMFSMRFLVQWIASERARRSVIPIAFWFFSVGGGAMLFIYAIHRKDPVFIVGQGAGLIIYFRNIYFILRKQDPLTASS
jgi:lipid-A-disaccharide synthase-like uncharacterized protein